MQPYGVTFCVTRLYTLSHYNNMKEVYLVKNYEDKLNMYVMGVFSSRVNAEAFIEKIEEKANDTLFEVKVIKYDIDFEDMEGY